MITRKAQRDAEIEAERQEKLKKAGAGKGSVLLNGRSLFQLDPSLFKDDEGALDDAELVIEKDNTPEEPEEEDRGVADDLADAVEALTLEDGTEVDTSLFEIKKSIKQQHTNNFFCLHTFFHSCFQSYPYTLPIILPLLWSFIH
eukprot:UN04030